MSQREAQAIIEACKELIDRGCEYFNDQPGDECAKVSLVLDRDEWCLPCRMKSALREFELDTLRDLYPEPDHRRLRPLEPVDW